MNTLRLVYIAGAVDQMNLQRRAILSLLKLRYMPTHEEKKILGIKEINILLNHTAPCSTCERIPPTATRTWRIPWKGTLNIVHLEGADELNPF